MTDKQLQQEWLKSNTATNCNTPVIELLPLAERIANRQQLSERRAINTIMFEHSSKGYRKNPRESHGLGTMDHDPTARNY